MKTPRDLVPCPRCCGKGTVELNDVLTRTLALLRRQKAEINGAALARLDGCGPNAMDNRLVDLERAGLASGRRNGRERLWRAT